MNQEPEAQSPEQQARAIAVEVAGIIREVLPRLRAQPSPDSLPRLLAAAALARELCLVEAMVAVCDAGQARVAGLLFRAQWETHLVGLYCMLAGKDGAKALIADRAFWAKKNEKVWNLDGPWNDNMKRLGRIYGEIPPQKMDFTRIANEVERLFAEGQVPIPISITTAHQRLYKGESMFTAHPGMDALLRHLQQEGQEWMPDVSFEPLPRRFQYLCNSALMAAGLVERFLDALDESRDRLDAATAKIALVMEPQQ
jgi:hypothetical protein